MQRLDYCFLCKDKFDSENVSSEHIIPNAIGGQLTNNSLLCKKCNSKLGNEIDSALTKQFEFVSSHLYVERDRGKHPVVRNLKGESGNEYHLKDGRKPVHAKPIIDKKDEGGKTTFSFKAGSRKQLKQFLESLSRKNQNFDIDEAMKKAKWGEEYLDEYVEVNIVVGGEDSMRSICKTAALAYLHFGGDACHINHLISFLTKKEKGDLVTYYFQSEDPYHPIKGEVNHIVYIKGNSQEKILYAFIEYFNTWCFVVKLNENYEGEDFEATYIYDLTSHVERKAEIVFDLTRNELIRIFNSETKWFEQLKSRMVRLVNIGEGIQTKLAFDEILKKAIEEHLLRKFENEDELNKSLENFTEAFIEKLYKLDRHLRKKGGSGFNIFDEVN